MEFLEANYTLSPLSILKAMKKMEGNVNVYAGYKTLDCDRERKQN